jgi:uncharacterized protein YdhG (YjbR/CyaY superfamily)
MQWKISYGMPTLYLNGNFVHFAAFKDHYGFFPSPSGIDAFEKELIPYRSGKGTLRFPIDKPIPCDIIQRVIQFRVKENLIKAKNEEPQGKPCGIEDFSLKSLRMRGNKSPAPPV